MSRQVATLGLAAAALSVLVGSVPIASSGAEILVARHQIERVLDQREHAVLTADADSWRMTLAQPADSAHRAQFEALDRLGLQTWSERLTTLEKGPDGSWRARVDVRYRFPGDRTDAVVSAVLDLTPLFRVAGWSASATFPWEIAGARTEAGRHSLVVGAGARAVLRTYAAELDRASASVGRMLGEPPPQVVLVLPTDWNQAGHMVPAGIGHGMAAVTSRLGPPGTNDGPVRILADAGVLARLDPASQTAVFGHEAFHVARHGVGSVPLWLAEGLADYAGYRESGIASELALAGLLRDARANGTPRALPEDAEFADPRHATRAYEGAHLAVRLLVEEHSSADVIALYQAVAAGGPGAIDAAMQQILRTDVASFTSTWRAEVATLAAR